MSAKKKRREAREIKLEVMDERESAQEFVRAWKQAARRTHKGPAVERICFLDIETMLKTLTNRRMDLLHTLRRDGPTTIRALSLRIKRDYKNVHADVKALKHVGLIETDSEGRIKVPWDRIATEIPLAA